MREGKQPEMTADAEPKGATGAPTTVFVSYSRDDRKRALPVIELLEASGFSVWWDGLLEGGERFSRTTEAALENARAVVVLWSKTAIASHWVHDEATRGRDRSVLVPLTIDGSEPPLGFRQYQTIDITRSRLKPGDAAADMMIRAVTALHDPATAPPPKPPVRKGIDRRAAIAGAGAVALVAGAGTIWWSGLFRGGGEAANSVGVLPFVNLSGDPAQTYFSDGLAAEVRTELARNPLLQVAAQASSNKFRDRSEDAKSIAQKLGVAYLLDGSIRRAGDTMRIAAELIDGRSGFSKWAQAFDRPIADVFAVQAEIARAVTTALSAEVGGQQADGAVANGTTTNITAFDAFLRGRDLLDEGSSEENDRAALAKFDAAIAADPNYGLAHAARSRTLTVIANQYNVQGPARRLLYDEAVAAAQRATQVAPQSADAWSALGFVLIYGRLDAKAAEPPYDRSYKLGSGDADVLSRYALFCSRIGRFELARTAMARSAALDLLNGRTVRLQGEVEFGARRFAQAVPLLERALVINPKMGVARSVLGSSKFLLGDSAGAEAAFAADPNRLFGLTGLAIVRHSQGRKSEAAQDLATLIAENGDNSLYQQAQIAAQWGETVRAMQLLQTARSEGDAGVMYARNDPFLDPVRRDPGFKDLLNSLGFR